MRKSNIDLRIARRDLLKLAGAGGAALAANAIAQAAPAEGQTVTPKAVTNGAGFYRFRMGEFNVTVLSDGQTVSPNTPFPNWGANPGRQAEFEQILRDNYLPVTPFVNNFNPMIVDAGKQRVLIDSGLGAASAQNGTGKLLLHMRAAGISPESITTVFVTHGHGDHISGLTNAQGKPTFSRAEHQMGEAEFNFWASRPEPSPAVKRNLIDMKSRFKLVQADQEIVPGLRTVAAFGHTGGQLAVMASSGGQSLMHLADAGGHFFLSLRVPDHYLGFDASPADAVATRQRLFSQAAADRIMVVGYHFPWPGVGYIKREGNAFAYVPAQWVWGA
jgi:glyoxylase-like metal-dependent hydrolase (beta-lactamase superfamily II)